MYICLLGSVIIACVFPSIIMVPYVPVHCSVTFLWLVVSLVVENLARCVTLLGRGAIINLFVGRGKDLLLVSSRVVVPRLLVLSIVVLVKLGRSRCISAWALVVWVVSRVALLRLGLISSMAVPRCWSSGIPLGVTLFRVFLP